MSGRTQAIVNIPPGIVRETSRFAAQGRWFDGNLVRWISDVLYPVGGWTRVLAFPDQAQPFRSTFSWRDNSYLSWAVFGSADKVWAVKIADPLDSNKYDITPVDLVWGTGPKKGYGAGRYGLAQYGRDQIDSGLAVDIEAIWSFYNFGKLLIAVHSQDGRLFSWDPENPGTPATPTKLAPVANAPTGNRVCMVSDERFAFVFGGKTHPRRIKWCSQENLTEWTPAETNTAGGFDLETAGIIRAVCKVQNGILILTDIDVHLLEYVGVPLLYGVRRISDVTGALGSNAAISFAGSAFWMSNSNFWKYDGNVVKVPCDIRADVFFLSDLTKDYAVHMGVNEEMQEIWTFYPARGDSESTRVAIYSFASQPWWSKGTLSRSCILNPIWDTRPLMAYKSGTSMYVDQHEVGWLDNGNPRPGIQASSGFLALEEGGRNLRFDRVTPDIVDIPAQSEERTYATEPLPYELEFELRNSPQGTSHIYGPVGFDNVGYKSVRFMAKLIAITVKQIRDESWGLGKLTFRTKAGGGR
jgi:hypothetical protein